MQSKPILPITLLVVILLLIVAGFMLKDFILPGSIPVTPPVNPVAKAKAEAQDKLVIDDGDEPHPDADISKNVLRFDVKMKGGDFIYTLENLSSERLGVSIEEEKAGLKSGEIKTLNVAPKDVARFSLHMEDPTAKTWHIITEQVILQRVGKSELHVNRDPTSRRLKLKWDRK